MHVSNSKCRNWLLNGRGRSGSVLAYKHKACTAKNTKLGHMSFFWPFERFDNSHVAITTKYRILDPPRPPQNSLMPPTVKPLRLGNSSPHLIVFLSQNSICCKLSQFRHSLPYNCSTSGFLLYSGVKAVCIQ